MTAAGQSAPAATRIVELQGHRGARGHAPENTLAGFAAALAIGVDTLELDVGMCRDDVVVVHHDLALNPEITRDAEGHWLEQSISLRTLDLHALQRFDVGTIKPGSNYHHRFPHQQSVPGARIPTLSEVFEWIQQRGFDRILFNIEVKSDPTRPGMCADVESFTNAVLTVIRDHEMTQRVMVQSFDWRIQRLIQRLAPGIPTAYLSSQRSTWDTIEAHRCGPSPWSADIDVHAHHGSVPRAVRAAGGGTWSPDFRDLKLPDLDTAKKHDLRVVVWTVNEREDIDRMLDIGVDGIISDYPDRVREALEARQLPLAARLKS